jgi:hypothetical protein
VSAFLAAGNHVRCAARGAPYIDADILRQTHVPSALSMVSRFDNHVSGGTMRIESRAFGIAAGGVAALTYVACAVLVAVAPEATQAVFSYVFHVDLTTLSRSLSLLSFAVGLVVFSAFIGLCASLTAWLYNALIARVPVTLSRAAAATR